MSRALVQASEEIFHLHLERHRGPLELVERDGDAALHLMTHAVGVIAHRPRLVQGLAHPRAPRPLQIQELLRRSELPLQSGDRGGQLSARLGEPLLLPTLQRDVVPQLGYLRVLLRADLRDLRAEGGDDHRVRHGATAPARAAE